jgi:hypothetical protein
MRIAFVGKKASGKTFAARYLEKKHKFYHKPLREGVFRILRILYYYGDHKHIPWEQEMRVYDALYKLDPDIWIGYLERRLRTSTGDIVVDDARYINEVQKLKELGFILIRINAPEDARKRRIGKALLDAAENSVILAEYFHKDLSSLYQADYTILNESRDSTRAALDIIIEKERLFENKGKNP